MAACLLGMATKEVMVTAPLVVLLYDRTFAAGSFKQALHLRKRLYVLLAVTWIPLGFFVISTGWDRGGTAGPGQATALLGYWLAQFQAVGRYAMLTVWPSPLVFDYGTVALKHPAQSLFYALGVVPCVAGTCFALMRRPALGFLGAWFFVILAPTSLMPVVTQTVAEHRAYLPMVAIVAFAVLNGYAFSAEGGSLGAAVAPRSGARLPYRGPRMGII